MKQLFTLALILTLFSESAFAQTTFIVYSTADSGPGSLREAITNVNNGSGTPPFSVSFTTAGPISLTSALPTIIESCTLIGASVLDINTGQGGTTIERSRANGIGDFSLFSLTALAPRSVVFSQLVLTNGNTANFGGAINASGTLDIAVNNCLISGNRASTGGGVAASFGSLTINHARIVNNSANQVGGIFAQDENTIIINSQLTENTGTQGGALRCDTYFLSSSMLLINTLISNNTATQQDAALRISSDGPTTPNPASVTLVNCTITNNKVLQPGNQGGIWVMPGGLPSLIMFNSIVFGNTVNGVQVDIDGPINAASSNNLIGAIVNSNGGLTDGVNSNLVGTDKNPYFRNVSAADFRLSACSPAINRGNNTPNPTSFDLEGSPRIVSGAIDLGAYEFNGSYSGVSAGPITVSGSASLASPARLTSISTGRSFVFTGPGGYVFSKVYRTDNTYTAFADEVIKPGLYTLTVYGAEGCPPAIQTVNVP